MSLLEDNKALTDFKSLFRQLLMSFSFACVINAGIVSIHSRMGKIKALR